MLRPCLLARSSRWNKARSSEGRSQSSFTNTAIVMDLLEAKEFIPTDFIESETNWFYTSLGIDGKINRRDWS